MNPEDYKPAPIWPLCSLYYLGKIENAPEGSPTEACFGLLASVQARLAGDCSGTAPLDELKVIALDLLSYFNSTSPSPAPPALTTAIGLLMGLSEEELAAPGEFLEVRAKVGRPANANARDIAFYLDMFHWHETNGQLMSLNSLVKAVAARLGVPVKKSVQAATLRRWRQEYVDMFDLRGEAKLD